jgi:hypothetical protein
MPVITIQIWILPQTRDRPVKNMPGYLAHAKRRTVSVAGISFLDNIRQAVKLRGQPHLTGCPLPKAHQIGGFREAKQRRHYEHQRRSKSRQGHYQRAAAVCADLVLHHRPWASGCLEPDLALPAGISGDNPPYTRRPLPHTDGGSSKGERNAERTRKYSNQAPFMQDPNLYLHRRLRPCLLRLPPRGRTAGHPGPGLWG